jgi:hypothetical protein
MILTTYNDSDTHIYQDGRYTWLPQLSDAVWKQVFYLNLNYSKQSNSIIVTVYKMLMQRSTDVQLQMIIFNYY